VDLREGELIIRDWEKLMRTGEFDPRYLHLKKVSPL
jgi:hypothetical protein